MQLSIHLKDISSQPRLKRFIYKSRRIIIGFGVFTLILLNISVSQASSKQMLPDTTKTNQKRLEKSSNNTKSTPKKNVEDHPIYQHIQQMATQSNAPYWLLDKMDIDKDFIQGYTMVQNLPIDSAKKHAFFNDIKDIWDLTDNLKQLAQFPQVMNHINTYIIETGAHYQMSVRSILVATTGNIIKRNEVKQLTSPVLRIDYDKESKNLVRYFVDRGIEIGDQNFHNFAGLLKHVLHQPDILEQDSIWSTLVSSNIALQSGDIFDMHDDSGFAGKVEDVVQRRKDQLKQLSQDTTLLTDLKKLDKPVTVQQALELQNKLIAANTDIDSTTISDSDSLQTTTNTIAVISQDQTDQSTPSDANRDEVHEDEKASQPSSTKTTDKTKSYNEAVHIFYKAFAGELTKAQCQKIMQVAEEIGVPIALEPIQAYPSALASRWKHVLHPNFKKGLEWYQKHSKLDVISVYNDSPRRFFSMLYDIPRVYEKEYDNRRKIIEDIMTRYNLVGKLHTRFDLENTHILRQIFSSLGNHFDNPKMIEEINFFADTLGVDLHYLYEYQNLTLYMRYSDYPKLKNMLSTLHNVHGIQMHERDFIPSSLYEQRVKWENIASILHFVENVGFLHASPPGGKPREPYNPRGKTLDDVMQDMDIYRSTKFDLNPENFYVSSTTTPKTSSVHSTTDLTLQDSIQNAIFASIQAKGWDEGTKRLSNKVSGFLKKKKTQKNIGKELGYVYSKNSKGYQEYKEDYQEKIIQLRQAMSEDNYIFIPNQDNLEQQKLEDGEQPN